LSLWLIIRFFFSDAADFALKELLGSGTYGEAYIGINTTSSQKYVFKLYRFGKLKRKKMMREILVTQSLCGHDNIIKLYHVVKQSLTGYPVLVFEYAKDTYYKELYPKLSPVDIKIYMYQILTGLTYAHSHGVVHKDLKPANIMIDHEMKTIKIIDWGLSQFVIRSKCSFSSI
jgi:casein kinase II subunit alpha